VAVTGEVMRYLLGLVRATREARELRLGASPRAAIVLMTAAKTLAAVRGRDFVIPDDVQELLEPTLGHRMVLEPAAELEGLLPETFLQRLIQQVEVPR
jgi:MoxR-like ATPase